MGREVVYCFKCQLRLIEEDFQSGKAVRVGVTTTCKKCLPELIAALPPEQKMALLTGAPLPVTTPQIPQLKTLPDKTGQTDRVPRVHRPVQATRTHRQAPQHTSMKLIGVGAVMIAGLAALMMLGGDDPPDNNRRRVARAEPSTPAPDPVAKPPPPGRPDAGSPATTRPDDSDAGLRSVQEALREAQAYREANPDDLEGIAKRFKAVMWNAERTPYFETAKKEFEEVSRRIAARTPPKPPPAGQPVAKPAEADPEVVAARPEPPPTPPSEPEPKPEPVSVKPDPKPVVVIESPEPEPALPELWKLLMENKAKLAGKTAPVALRAPFDKSKTVIENVSDTTLEMSVAFGGGQAGATKKAEELDAGELRKLFVLAGVSITPELEKRLADLVAERERAKVEAAYDEAMDKAEKRMAQEDGKGAVAALNEALRLKPGDPDAKRLLAQAEKLAPGYDATTGGNEMAFQDGTSPTPDYAGTADAYITENVPEATHGRKPTLLIDGDEPNRSGKDCAVLLRWDVSAIPRGCTVLAVTLTLHVHNTTPHQYEVYAMKRDWTEGEVSWDHPSTEESWDAPGASGSLDRGLEVLGRIGSRKKGACSFDLPPPGIAQVQSWINDPTTNHGFIIVNSNNSDGLDLNSRETDSPDARPKLTVVYKPTGR